MPYTDEQRREAVGIYRTEGMAAAHAATGVPKPSIKRWADEQGVTTERSDEQTKAATEAHVEQMAAKRRGARSDLADGARDLLGRIAKEDSPQKCQSLAIAAAILIDKWQIVGWGDGDAVQTGNPDLERMREDARKKGRALVAV